MYKKMALWFVVFLAGAFVLDLLKVDRFLIRGGYIGIGLIVLAIIIERSKKIKN
ncbi:MAG: hypothetical protein ACRDAX_08305 [Propionibacteriaceae bacterium]